MSHGHSIRCHSPYRHYAMFHSVGGFESFNNSIFGGFRTSTTYNFNFNDGGFWGGFKNGLGRGLGYMFGGFLSGLTSGFMGGMYGNFWSLNPLSGFMTSLNSGGSFWGTNPNSGFMRNLNNGDSFWNQGNPETNAGSRRSRTALNSNSEVTAGTHGSHTSSKCDDTDQKNLHDLRERFNNIKSKEPLSEDDLNKLYSEVKKIVDTNTPLDESHKDGNMPLYKQLLDEIEKFAKDNSITLQVQPAAGGTPGEHDAGKVNGGDAVVTGTTADVSKQTLQAWQALNPNLSQEDADKLNGYGLKIDGNCCIPTKELPLDALKLLKDKGIAVAVAHNTQSSDAWIKGKITEIEEENGALKSYIIDCVGVGTYGLKYKVTKKTDGKYQVECISKNQAELYKLSNGAEFEMGENGVLTRKGKPLISKTNADGYEVI